MQTSPTQKVEINPTFDQSHGLFKALAYGTKQMETNRRNKWKSKNLGFQ